MIGTLNDFGFIITKNEEFPVRINRIMSDTFFLPTDSKTAQSGISFSFGQFNPAVSSSMPYWDDRVIFVFASTRPSSNKKLALL